MMQRQSVRAIVIHDGQLLAMKRNKFGEEFYTLIGGHLESGEDWVRALRRELVEETGLKVGTVRLVLIGDGGDLYGQQQFYLCEYLGGDPRLSPASEEAEATARGDNTYQPVWLSLQDISRVTFRPAVVGEAILEGIENGFPEKPRTLAWTHETVTK